jgi:hypothetical protein
MPAPQVEHDELDACLRRALQNGPYPTPAQRMEARAALLTRAAHQTMRPPAQARAALFAPLLQRAVAFRVQTMRLLRHLLVNDEAFRRAPAGSFGRGITFTQAPFVHFQPMW